MSANCLVVTPASPAIFTNRPILLPPMPISLLAASICVFQSNTDPTVSCATFPNAPRFTAPNPALNKFKAVPAASVPVVNLLKPNTNGVIASAVLSNLVIIF